MPAGRPKGSSGVNKSAAIREYLSSNPSATGSEVMEALGARGIDVSQALIAGVRSRELRGPGNKTRKVSEITASELASVTSLIEKFEDSSIILGVIEEIGTLVDSFGSFDRFKQAIGSYKASIAEDADMVDESFSESENDSEEDEESEEDDDEDDEDEESEEDDDDDDD